MAVTAIIDKIEEIVTIHLNSEPMKQVISSNALELFNMTCCFKPHDIDPQFEETSKEILIEEPWLETHVKLITLATIAFDKVCFQELVNMVIHSSTTQSIIGNLEKAACNRHTTKATHNFTEIINAEHGKEKSSNDKKEEDDENNNKTRKFCSIKQGNKWMKKRKRK